MHLQSTSTPNRRKKYGRNSSDEQDKMGTIDSQIAAVDDWDRARGGDPQPDDWYVDEGWSGFALERPALDMLRDDAARSDRDWHELVIYDTSRLSREPGHRLYILEPELKELGITITYVASPVYEDTADGRAMAGVQGVFDKWYADKTKETMRRGLRDCVRGGVVWWAPYGYEVVRTFDARTARALFEIRIKPEEAEIVRWVYAEVLAGRSTVEITRDLIARGVPTRNGGRWWPSTVRDMIYDRYYTGEAAYGATQCVLPKRRRDPLKTHRKRPKTRHLTRAREQWMSTAVVPRMIEPDVQERAQAILQGNQRRRAQPRAVQHALRGLLRCCVPHADGGPCGEYSLAGHAPHRMDGSTRRYYRCVWRKLDPSLPGPKTCPNQLPGDDYDAKVWEAVIGALQRTPKLRAALKRVHERPLQQRRQLEEAITRVHAERDALRKALRTQQRLFESGAYTRVEYEVARGDTLPELEAVEQNLAHAERSLAALRVPAVDVDAVERLCSRIAAKGAKASLAERGDMLRELVTRIDVYADRLEIHGVLGTIAVPRQERFQLNTDGAFRIKPVSFRLVIPRIIGNGQQDGQGAGDASYTLVFGEVA